MQTKEKEECQNRIKTMCLFCKIEIEKWQTDIGKAVCRDCEASVFPKEEKQEKTPKKIMKKVRDEQYHQLMNQYANKV